MGNAYGKLTAFQFPQILHTVIAVIDGVYCLFRIGEQFRSHFCQLHLVGEVTVAMHNGIRASLIILCIALGVAILNIFVRRMVAPKREQKHLKLLVERTGDNGS